MGPRQRNQGAAVWIRTGPQTGGEMSDFWSRIGPWPRIGLCLIGAIAIVVLIMVIVG
jgi:hypothetical protein